MKKGLFILRQLLVLLLLGQLLNLSVCSESYWEYYNYGSKDNRYDPTETVMEWVIETWHGNQDAFSYNNGLNMKGLSKAFAWHIDLPYQFPLPPAPAVGLFRRKPPAVSEKPFPAYPDIISPPPERAQIA